ncbi:transposon-encoded TnpW family protein [Dorea formicigenerans]|uniref:transposon-encoded TnpW family protein n=1 Tax=Dorea formicigenerans TaxID=39486 RepID=UPI002ED0C988
MTDNKQHDTRTARRPDCVTEIRMGNSVLVVSGYFKKDTTTTAADKMARYGKIAAVRYEPADAGQLAALLRAEQEGRETLAPGRIGDHIRGLNAGRILDEARRIVADVQRLAAGETVKGAHDSRFFYSVPISRDFLALSTDEDLTRLYTVLPFVKHDICAPEHDGGRFVAIPRDENLNQKIRATAARSSPSVLHQLQQAKKEAAREAAKAATIKKGKGEMTL